MKNKHTTDFGFTKVSLEEKAERVAGVFRSVAGRYDLMNDLMSAGIHRLWKRFTIELSAVRPGHKVLDIAGGTGDLAYKFAHIVKDHGQVILADINDAMLIAGRNRLINRGMGKHIQYLQTDAQYLPFADDTFDCITMAFGLRNVVDKDLALAAMLRVLNPGGRLLILEFSKPTNKLFNKAYDEYSFRLLPLMGQIIAGDADSYRYLAESIRMHPDQETLTTMMTDAGFECCEYYNMSGGIVALHKGIKP